MAKKKTAREKLTDDHFKIVEDAKGRGMMLIPKASDIEAMIKKVGRGKLVTPGAIRDRLAKQYGVDFSCPLVSGIFIRLIAEAAEEESAAGKKDIAPYWRVVKDDGSLNEKYPGGVERQAKKLKGEGFELLPPKGKKPPKVKNYERYLG